MPQIHAPEAWAAGYNGTGATVAVLDTGLRPHPPRPAGQGRSQSRELHHRTPSVIDGNGHGTHVASTVAGSGAASDGLRKGVAPGADLMIGKVLGDGGYGEDSWVLAGMAWAVDQGADVVSMSLGGDADDGTNPLSQAVNELSAGSDTLFVIAAGNDGGTGASTVSSPGSAGRRADRRRGRRQRRHGLASPAAARACADGGLKPEVSRPRRRRHRRPRRRHRRSARLVDDVLHDAQRHLDGHAARGRPRRDPQAGAPELGRRAAEGRHRQQHRAGRRTPPRSTPAPAGSTPSRRSTQDGARARPRKSLGNFAWPYSDLAAEQHPAHLHQHRPTRRSPSTSPWPARTARP